MVSVIILTKNNETTLRNTLDSIRWCDQIIVVDDHSTDDTISIAKEYTDDVYIRSLSDDFASQRNFALQKAVNDWVFFIDSDEVVPDLLRKEILQSAVVHPDIAGFYIKRNDVIFGTQLQHGETSHVRLLRLAKRGAGEWERAVHETWNIRGKTSELHNTILHFPHQTIREFIDDINRYSSVNARVFLSQGKKSSLFHIIMYPPAKFIQNYCFRLGFLDGTAGFVFASLMSFHSFLTRAKMYLSEHETKRNP